MVRIVATPVQAKLFAESADEVEVVDVHGNRLGYLARPFTQDDVRLAIERMQSKGPRRTTQEVLQRFQSLE